MTENANRKYKIAWLPGDGIGVDVLDAARIVLDKIELDAEYIHGDIGWEFWCKEGDAFPARTIELLKNVNAAMFGAITSKPVKAAELELDPSLKDKGFIYRSPIVRMRQMFDLYICLRPCKAYPGNPLNYQDDIDLVIFRENTEGLYSGVEFNTLPAELAETLSRVSKNFAPFKDLPLDQVSLSAKIVTRKGSERIIRAAFEYARKFHRKKVTIIHKANVIRATAGHVPGHGQGSPQGFPRHRDGRCQRGRHLHVAAEEPEELRCHGCHQHVRRYHLRPVRPDGGRAGFRLLGEYWYEIGSI